MQFRDEDDNLIKLYLLGDTTVEEQQQIEERLFDDSTFASRFDLVEHELISDYASGWLTAAERTRFEQHFLAVRHSSGVATQTTTRHEQLHTMKALLQYVAQANTGVASATRTAWSEQQGGWRALLAEWWRLPVFAVLLISIALGIGQIFLRQSATKQGLAALNRAFRSQRLTEVRITGLAHAALWRERGDERRQIDEAELDEATALLRKAAREHSDAATLHALGKLYLAKDERERAIEQFNAALKLAPNQAALHSDLGAALVAQISSDAARNNLQPSVIEQAFQHLNRALELMPELLEPLFNRALLYQMLRLDEPARRDWEAYLQRDRSSAWGHEAEVHLKQLPARKSSAALPVDELQRNFLIAYHSGDDEQAWQAYNASFLRHGNYITSKLIDDFLAQAAAGQGAEAEEQLHRLEYLGRLAERNVQDRFTVELASVYRRAGQEQLAWLAQGRKLRQSAYELSPQTQHQQAIEACLAAQSLFERAAAWPEALLAEYWIAEAHLRQSEQRQSLTAFAALAEKCRQHDYHWLRALTFNRLASVLGDQSEYSAALRYCNAAAAEFKRLGDRSGQLRTLINLASLYRFIGKHREAINLCHEALALAQQTVAADESWTSVLHAISGSSFYRLGLYSAALECQSEAVRQVERLNHPQSISRYCVDAGLIYSRLKDYDRAISYIERGLEIGQQRAASPTGRDMLNYARLYLGQVNREAGRSQAAAPLLEQADEFYQRGDWAAQVYLIAKERLLNQLALGDFSSAGTQLNYVLGLLEQHRRQILQQSNRNSFFDKEQSVYDIAIGFTAANLAQPERAFNYSELSRARSLLDSVTLTRQIATEADLPDEVLGGSTQPLTLAEIQPHLPHNVQILQYAVLPECTIAWVVTRERFVSKPLNFKADELIEKVKTLTALVSRQPVAGDPDWRTASGALYEMLVAPVEELLDKRKILCVTPDKMLNFLPYGALFAPHTGRLLIEDYVLLSTPSATLFSHATAAAERQTKLRHERVLSVGNPAFDRTRFALPELPAAAVEAAQIVPLYDGGSALIGKNATKRALLRAMTQSEVVHLATHYLTDERSPMLSQLLLAAEMPRAQESTSNLALHEVYRLQLAHVRLAVLAACRTTVESYYNGEGAIGLARPFQAAGVPLVIASLWPVDSDATSQLMIRFHALRRQQHLASIAALREAQIELLFGADARLRHPYYWAAFIASGGYSRV